MTLAAEVRPHDVGVIAWISNPQRFTSFINYSAASYAGRVFAFPFMSDLGGSVSKISYGVNGAGAGMSNSFLGIYDVNGNLLGTSVDQSANMMVVGTPAANMVSPVVLAPGTWYQVALLIGAATTTPTFMGQSQNSPGFTNMGIPVGKYLCSYSSGVAGLTALPAKMPATMAQNAGGIVAVMS
jgi:hypothetical protein